MLSTSFDQVIDSYIGQIDNNLFFHHAQSGALSQKAIHGYLYNLQHLVSHTPINLARAKASATQKKLPQLAHYFHQKIEEETGHHLWAEEDLKKSGISPQMAQQTLPVLPQMEELLHFHSLLVAQHPASYLAHIYLAETLTVKVGPLLVNALNSQCGFSKDHLTIVTHHIELDQDHAADGSDFLDHTDELRPYHEPILSALHQDLDLFHRFCNAVALLQ